MSRIVDGYMSICVCVYGLVGWYVRTWERASARDHRGWKASLTRLVERPVSSVKKNWRRGNS